MKRMDWKYPLICSILNINFPYEYNDVKINFPKDCFGVFVTIERSNEINGSNIHGCIGHWEYKIIEERTIFNHMIKVGRDASFEDNRSKKFDDLILDPNAKIEVNFMLNDIKKINVDFDNSKYGVLVSRNGKFLATYLPKVFKDQSWDYIRKSLIRKAGIDDNNLIFYSYPSKIISFNLIDIFDDREFTYFWMRKLSQKLIINNDIPYLIVNDRFKYHKDYVRNISSLSTLIKYGKVNGDSKVNEYEKILNGYSIDYKNYDLQTLSFLVDATDKNEIIEYFCKKAHDEVDEEEKIFSKGEILLSMCRKCNFKNDYYEEKMKNIMADREHNIFMYNWHSKFFRCLAEKGVKVANSNLIANEVLSSFGYGNSYETNELAVMLECFVSTFYFSSNRELIEKSFIIFILLLRRINAQYWLKFKDGTARLDITMHVFEGLYK